MPRVPLGSWASPGAPWHRLSMLYRMPRSVDHWSGPAADARRSLESCACAGRQERNIAKNLPGELAPCLDGTFGSPRWRIWLVQLDFRFLFVYLDSRCTSLRPFRPRREAPMQVVAHAGGCCTG
jgi:hypothetical protein